MRPFKKFAIVAGSGLATVGFASGAWAFFTAAATAGATAQVGTVAPATGVTAVQTAPGPATVHVHWTGPIGPSLLPRDGYYVERLAGPTASPACNSAPGTLLGPAAVDCDDLNVATGSYAYRVTAVYQTWTAPSAPGTVTVDATPPTVTIARASGQLDPTNAVPVHFTVTFSEPVLGFDASDVTLGGTATGATVAPGPALGAVFDVDVSATGDGPITVDVKTAGATDPAGNTNTASPGPASVVYDTTAPAVASVNPE